MKKLRIICDRCKREEILLEVYPKYIFTFYPLLKPKEDGWANLKGKDYCPKCMKAYKKIIKKIHEGFETR